MAVVPSERAPRSADRERRRLEHRSRRMGFVIDALQDRARTYERGGGAPAPLLDAIAEFSRRLHEDRRRLAELHGGTDARARRLRSHGS